MSSCDGPEISQRKDNVGEPNPLFWEFSLEIKYYSYYCVNSLQISWLSSSLIKKIHFFLSNKRIFFLKWWVSSVFLPCRMDEWHEWCVEHHIIWIRMHVDRPSVFLSSIYCSKTIMLVHCYFLVWPLPFTSVQMFLKQYAVLIASFIVIVLDMNALNFQPKSNWETIKGKNLVSLIANLRRQLLAVTKPVVRERRRGPFPFLHGWQRT